MTDKNFNKMIDTLRSGKTLTFWTSYNGTKCTEKHITLFKNDVEEKPGFWIGKTYYLIPCIKITVN